ncbi:MAG: FAD-dependent oxidoreductase [Verrucomicrobiota bacterium]|nr:FAD-dependent oxidoreductase [Verrucomicrobiota bacterium]
MKISLVASLALLTGSAFGADSVLVEAESFKEPGGWVLDTQFIQIMGSPYLMAHGLGTPVKDATTTVKLPGTGKFRVFVRTKDWVAKWNAPGAPGKFQVVVDGKPLEKTFGTTGAEWFWEDGGTVEITKPEVELALKDLTGFNGRCDAIYLLKDGQAAPPKDGEGLAKWRRDALGLPEKPANAGEFDLVVVGGGYGGMGAAISAARMGCKVALIQDRPVLGGNGSSEVRVWAMGGIRRGLYPNLGEIVEEFQDRAKSSPGTFEEFGDAKKEGIVRAEKNISLFLNNHVLEAEMRDPANIAAVTALDTKTSERRRFSGKFFCDATGHGTLGALAKAELTVREKEHLGMSNMWRWDNAEAAQAFPETPWALSLEMEDFPYPKRNHGEWFWESGFDKHPLDDLEYIRDWNLRAVFGAFNAMKNRGGKAEHPNARLEWVAYIGGTRESRQILGDVLLTRDDIADKKLFPDGTVPTTWDIDLHYPKEQYAVKFPDNPFIAKAVFGKGVDRQHGYPVPYRCFYSKNIENLFTAGRCISVTHEALGTVRVMKTGGMIGEVVGKAASICIKNGTTPRGVYERYWPELKELLQLRGAARRETVNSPITLPAGYTPPPVVSDKREAPAGIALTTLKGLVLDDEQARLTGTWSKGTGLPDFVAKGYQFASPKAAATARYEFSIKDAGQYEVRVNYGAHENRATNAPVTIESAEGTKSAAVDQRKELPATKGFTSLGVFRFEPGKPAAVTFKSEGANGTVHIDAVQLVPQP